MGSVLEHGNRSRYDSRQCESSTVPCTFLEFPEIWLYVLEDHLIELMLSQSRP